jgi:protein-S-isoprenylcysteine O-methyltransferase Ste14
MVDLVKNGSRARQPLAALALCNAVAWACFTAALACLWQWDRAAGVARIDRFSGGALLFYFLLLLLHFRFCRRLMALRVPLGEAFGSTFDPLMGLFNALLIVGQLTAFLDYAHWHLTPRLEIAALQYAGLVLYLLSLATVAWSDRHLVPGLAGEPCARQPVTTGPYKYVRHPRYAALFLSNIALALTLASVPAWMCAVAWFLVVRRRIRLEEQHLRATLGAAYEQYATLTGGLFPRLRGCGNGSSSVR